MRVDQTPLPGVGIRYDFLTEAGRRIGVIAHRDGGVEMFLYAADDDECVSEAVVLRPDERAALVELLAAPPGGSDASTRTEHRVWQLSD